MATAPGGGPAFADAGLASPSQYASSLASRLARLPDLDSVALREEWRRLRGSEPPRVSRDLLVRAIAYGLQEREFGGLPKWARQSLTGLGAPSVAIEGHGPDTPRAAPPAPVLKPGARLVREWHGRLSYLAPDIVVAILSGRQPAALTANKLMADTRLPLSWDAQRYALGFA